MSVGKTLLQVRDLTTYFYVREGAVKAVDRVSLEVKVNEVVGIVGESGSGKSVTALSIVRLVPYPGRTIGGEVDFRGESLLRTSAARLRKIRGDEISMVFQDPMTYLNPVMRVGDQVAEAIEIHRGTSGREVRDEVVRLLESVLLPSPDVIADYYPHQLSGGQKQRVLIAIAISCKPSLIIADEPTTALDVTVQAQILSLLKKASEELGTSVLLITHDMAIVAGLCDRVYVMYAGRIAESADVVSLFSRPLHPYTQALLRSTLSIDEFKPELETIEGSVPSLLFPPAGCLFQQRCPFVMEKCRTDEPPLFSKDGHVVACWLYESGR
jgi:peptide/nickel transport system ATP-binding protein